MLKYHRIYQSLILKRQQCSPKGEVEIHHIIPKCLGGDDQPFNLVPLSVREHFIAHLLLARMYPKGSEPWIKMQWALHRMSFSGRIHSRKYEWYRQLHSKFLKEYHPSKNPEWRKRVSERVLENWRGNTNRRKQIGKVFDQTSKQRIRDNPEQHRILSLKGAQAAKLVRANRLEYKGRVYLGYLDLQNATGVSKHLYKKYYLNGFDPEDRIGKDGPPSSCPRRLES